MIYPLKYGLFFWGMFSFLSLSAQTPAEKTLDKIGYEKSAFQSMGHIPVFELQDAIMYEPVDLTGADIFKVTTAFTEVILPQNESSYQWKSVAYGYFYRNFEIKSKKKEYLAFIIPDYLLQRTNHKLDIWVDYNDDGDFSNDPKPNLKSIGAGKWFLQLDSFGGGYDLQWFPVPQFRKFAQMNDTAMKELIGPRRYLGSNYSLKANRKAVLYTSIGDSLESAHVGVLDRDFNGSFTDENDLILLSESDSIFNADNSLPLSKANRVPWKGRDYEFNILKSKGEYQLVFRELGGSKNRISIGKKLPKVKAFITPKSTKKVDLQRKLKRRRITKVFNKKAEVKLIYVWSAINSDFERDSSALHQILRKNASNPKFDALLLNFGGSIRYITGYNSRFSLTVKQLIADSKTISKLSIQKMPQFILLDRKNRILYIGSNLQSLEDYINRAQ